MTVKTPEEIAEELHSTMPLATPRVDLMVAAIQADRAQRSRMYDPYPWLYPDGCREDVPRHLRDESGEHSTVIFDPRPGYSQRREDYAS